MKTKFAQADVRDLIQEIDGMISVNFDNLQPWTAFEEWELGDLKDINGSRNLKILETDEHIRFLTQIKPLIEFPKHWHDCAEACTVLAGTLSDRLTGKSYGVGEVKIFSKGEPHIPYNPSKTETLYLIVDFYK